MLTRFNKSNTCWTLIISRSYGAPTNKRKDSNSLRKVINEDDDALLNGLSETPSLIKSNVSKTKYIRRKPSKTPEKQSNEQINESEENKTKTKSDEYISNLKAQREVNLKRLEKLRNEEKTQVFSKYSRLLKEYTLNIDVLANMSRIPLISNEMIESNEISEFYDREEYEWATKTLLSHKKENVLSEATFNQTKWLYPSISSIISLGDEKKYQKLLEWKLNEMESSSYEGFIERNALIKKKGVDFHNAIELTFKKQPLPTYDSDIEASVNAIQKLIKEEFKDDFFLLEANVAHSRLAYQGRIDCLGYYKDQFCLIDWKRSDAPKADKESLFDYPVQLAAYLGAYLNDFNFRKTRQSHDIQGGLIINISDDGQANVHSFNYQQMEFYWYKWINVYRSFLYSALKFKKEKIIN